MSDESTEEVLMNAFKVPYTVNLVEMCYSRRIDEQRVDWDFFPRSVTFDLVFVDSVSNQFATVLGTFSHNGRKFVVHLFLPKQSEEGIGMRVVKDKILYMLEALLRRQECNSNFMRRVESICLSGLYAGFYKVLTKTTPFGEIAAMRNNLDDCLTSVLDSLLDINRYKLQLENDFPDNPN
jgi:hypothetical protein